MTNKINITYDEQGKVFTVKGGAIGSGKNPFHAEVKIYSRFDENINLSKRGRTPDSWEISYPSYGALSQLDWKTVFNTFYAGDSLMFQLNDQKLPLDVIIESNLITRN